MNRKKPQPIDVLVGQRIRIERVARGISQTALGEKIGVSFQQLQKYEKGVNRIGASRLMQIARALRMPVGAFFEGSDPAEPEKTDTNSPIALLALPDAVRLMRAYARIGGAARKAVIDLLEAAAVHPGGKSSGKR